MSKPNVINRKTPVLTAQMFREQQRPTLIKYNRDWLAWDGAAYQMIEDDTIESEILHWLNACKQKVRGEVMDPDNPDETKVVMKLEPFHPIDADTVQVNKTLIKLYHVPTGTMDPPFFLDGGTGEHAGLDPKNLTSFRNGLLDVTTRVLYPATSAFFTRFALPFDYDPEATCPQWLAFQNEVLAGDAGLIALMQQWFGHLITTTTKPQALLYLRGMPGSGKGTTGRVIDELVGSHNISSHTIADLAEGFGREGLIGKSLLKVTDMNTDGKANLSEAASIINAITGEDPIHVRRKFKGALELKLKTHVVLMGNTFPNFGGHTAAIGRRMKVIPFNISFEGREDIDLTDKLITELPGVLNWALDGLDSLRAEGRFLTVAASEDAKLEIMTTGNTEQAFLAECCEIGDPAFATLKDDVFEAYVGYCARTKSYAQNSNEFFKRIKTAAPSLQDKRPRVGDDPSRPRWIVGLRLRDDGPPTTLTLIYRLDPDLVDMHFSIGCIEGGLRGAVMVDPKTMLPIEVDCLDAP